MERRAYRVEFAPAARREMRGLAPDVRRRVAARIGALADNPRPPGCKTLSGVSGEMLHRIRVGDWRVLYTIHDDIVLVVVVRVGHRREVYRG